MQDGANQRRRIPQTWSHHALVRPVSWFYIVSPTPPGVRLPISMLPMESDCLPFSVICKTRFSEQFELLFLCPCVPVGVPHLQYEFGHLSSNPQRGLRYFRFWFPTQTCVMLLSRRPLYNLNRSDRMNLPSSRSPIALATGSSILGLILMFHVEEHPTFYVHPAPQQPVAQCPS